jgi:hypothetical protein
MKKTIEITMPESWAEITLRQYLDLSKELENYKEDEDASTAILLYKLCGLDPDVLNSISSTTYNVLKHELAKFMNITEMELQRKIFVNDIEYGFEPNLSQISYGAYADISKYDTIQIDDNWAKIMSILYRPIDKTNKDTYSIKAYEGKIDNDLFLDVTMDIHFGALFFFVHLSTDLLVYTLNSTMATEVAQLYNTTSLKNGNPTQQLLNSQMEILQKLMK